MPTYAHRVALPLFTELPRGGLLGNQNRSAPVLWARVSQRAPTPPTDWLGGPKRGLSAAVLCDPAPLVDPTVAGVTVAGVLN